MPSGTARPELLRKRIKRRFYRWLVGFYRAAFRTVQGPRPIAPGALRRILVVQHYGVGDMILTTPLLAFLKARAPEAEIDVLASRRNAPVVADDEGVAHVFVHDHAWRGWLHLAPRLRRRRYDVIFSGQAGKGLREGLVASIAAHRRTHKVSVWRPKRYHGFFTTVVRIPPSVTHIADRLLYMAHNALGDDLPRPTVVQYPLRIAENDSAAAQAAGFIASFGLEWYVLVNVSAHFSERDWAPEPCARFVSILLERHPDVTVVLTRAPGKEWQAERVAMLCASSRVVVAPAMPLLAVAALARDAVAVVTTETSLIHIASARHRPVVALYAPESPSEVAHWLPLGVPYRALVSRVREGMTDIPAVDIADALDEVCAVSANQRMRTART
jgi:ADP-heptose:LPS heptosyltransferase